MQTIKRITIEANSTEDQFETSVFKNMEEFTDHAPVNFDDEAEGRSFIVEFRNGTSYEFYHDGDGWACREQVGVMRQDYAYAQDAIEDLLDATKSLSMTP